MFILPSTGPFAVALPVRRIRLQLKLDLSIGSG